MFSTKDARKIGYSRKQSQTEAILKTFTQNE